MVRFILSASPFSSGVFGTVNSSRIPFEQQYSSIDNKELLDNVYGSIENNEFVEVVEDILKVEKNT